MEPTRYYIVEVRTNIRIRGSLDLLSGFQNFILVESYSGFERVIEATKEKIKEVEPREDLEIEILDIKKTGITLI